jgi:putative hydrolase of the HAD superfamily
MYKNIIFDIGNVLLNFKPEEYLKTKIREADRVSEIHKEIFQSEEWLMLDRGTLTEEEAKSILIRNSSRNGHLIELAFENWYELLTPIEDSVEVLKELKGAGYKVYFLSNFHLLAFEYITNKFDFFNMFDGGIVSYREKLLKPEKGIYKRLIEEYKIKPEESVFIDDVQANIEAARKLNFQTILFKNGKDLRKKLYFAKLYGGITMFRELRRNDRELEDVEAIEILEKCEYGILSTVSENGYAYGVPLSYVYIDNSIYFHCATEGHKLDNIKNKDKVSFCVVGQTSLLPDKFSTKYESVILFGRAIEVFDSEKEVALLELIIKYSQEYIEKGKEYIKNASAKTKVIKISIEHISGKARR